MKCQEGGGQIPLPLDADSGEQNKNNQNTKIPLDPFNVTTTIHERIPVNYYKCLCYFQFNKLFHN